MTKEEAEKVVWDFAGLNRELQTLMHWEKRLPRAAQRKMDELAEQLVAALCR